MNAGIAVKAGRFRDSCSIKTGFKCLFPTIEQRFWRVVQRIAS